MLILKWFIFIRIRQMLKLKEYTECPKICNSKISENLYYLFVFWEINIKKWYKILSYILKTEYNETWKMIKLILKKTKTEEDKKFIKEQFWDLWKMWTIVLIWTLPLWTLLLFITKKMKLDLSCSAMKEIKDK